MGWFGIGGISEQERQAIWHSHYQKNQLNEQRRAELQRNFDVYLTTELNKLYKKLHLSVPLQLSFNKIVVIEELWAKVLGNGDIKTIPAFIIEDTEEMRRACKTFKYHEIAKAVPFSQLLIKDFMERTQANQMLREEQLAQECEALNSLFQQVQKSHLVIYEGVTL